MNRLIKKRLIYSVYIFQKKKVNYDFIMNNINVNCHILHWNYCSSSTICFETLIISFEIGKLIDEAAQKKIMFAQHREKPSQLIPEPE